MHELMVVDVQPQFSSPKWEVTGAIVRAAKTHTGPILAFWVGEGLTDDTLEDVQNYWVKMGFPRRRLSEVRWIEKDYGFFRGWMDNGVDDTVIVRTLRYLNQQGLRDSSELSSKTLAQLTSKTHPRHSTLRWPGFDAKLIGYVEHWNTCGGGRDECLKEIELLLKTTDVSFERLDHLVYG